jgi:hypothetical protein
MNQNVKQSLEQMVLACSKFSKDNDMTNRTIIVYPDCQLDDPEFQIPVGARSSAPVQDGEGMALTTHPYLAPRLKQE